MSLPQKEELAEEIHRHQPHLLASCIVQPKLGAHINDVEFLLNVLLVCYQAMKESGLRWPMITEDEQERQMQRWIGAVDFTDHALGNSASHRARQQYAILSSEWTLLDVPERLWMVGRGRFRLLSQFLFGSGSNESALID